MIIVSGYLSFILTMIEGFVGYLLCWGQMPYWGITVMINPIAVFPCSGIIIAELIWSAGWVILNRILLYHFLIGILIGVVILIHIFLLHSFSSSNPTINNHTLIIHSYPFIFKDLYWSCITINSVISIFTYWEPDSLGNSDNQIISNPLITPNNILPEWYYLLFHSRIRASPNKMIVDFNRNLNITSIISRADSITLLFKYLTFLLN